MSDNDELIDIRNQIDSLDEQIQELISQRARAAQRVAKIKLDEDPDAVFYRPEREAQVLRAVQERNTGPLTDEDIARLFREIMSVCLALEKPLKTAFLGPEGTYTQAAALKHFGHAVKTVPVSTISDVFQEVEAGSCHYGVVPVENSTEGVVNHTLDMFLNSPLKICGEVTLRIHHNLLSMSKDLNTIRKVYAHQQALAQCRSWLDRYLPDAEHVPVSSNGEASKMAHQQEDAGAIAGEIAGEIYNVPVLCANISDEADNTTRFLVIGSQDVAPSGEDKTSLLVTIKNKAGGLHNLLTPLAEHGISMSRIESRPSRRGMWDYVFFIDVDGHRDEPRLQKALALLEQDAGMYKELGSYPKAVL